MPTVNVLSFGAKGDGSTNDRAAIQAALDFVAATGGELFFPAGTYKLNTPLSTSATTGLTLRGEGRASVLKCGDITMAHLLALTGSKVTVENLAFDGNYTAGDTDGPLLVRLDATLDITFRDVAFLKAYPEGLVIAGNCRRTLVDSCTFDTFLCAIFSDDDGVTYQPTKTTITKCLFRSGRGTTSTAGSGAIKFSGRGSSSSIAQHIITQNTIDSAGQMGIELQTWCNDTTISQNVITNVGYGISISGCTRVALTANEINDPATYGIEIASASSYIACQGNVLHCDGVNGYEINGDSTDISITGGSIDDSATCIVFEDFARVAIQGVAMQCNSGGMVTLKNGTDAVISGCLMTGGASLFNYIYLDSTNDPVQRVLIAQNLLTAVGGAIANNGITLVSTANSITDVTICGNHVKGVQMPGGGINSGSSTSKSTRLLRFRCFGNVGSGLCNQVDRNFNFGLNVQTGALTWFYDYWYYEQSTMFVDASGGACTVDLPDPTGLNDYEITVMKGDSSGNLVTVSTPAGQINGAATYTGLTAQWKRATFKSNGYDWNILNSN